MALVNTMNWRYATKKFDNQKELSEEHITDLLKGMNLAPSSLGLQPYEFIVVNDPKLQQQLREHSYNQSQISDASHVIVIAAKTKITNDYIDEYMSRTADIRGVSIENLDGFKSMITNFVDGKTDQELFTWSQKQCYIVLGTLMALCADMHIDSCPMEGFNPEKYNEILKLDEKDLYATLVIPVGYRSPNDEYADMKKSRHHLDEITSLYYK